MDINKINSMPDDAFETVCKNVCAGMSLTELSRLWDIPYSDLFSWIKKDSYRFKRYEEALEIRDEFIKSRLIDELKHICFSDLRKIHDKNGNMLPMNEWPEDIASAVSGLDETLSGRVKIKLNDKMKAIDMLGRELDMFATTLKSENKITIEDLVSQSVETESEDQPESIPPPEDSNNASENK